MKTWDEVRAWRVARRRILVPQRKSVVLSKKRCVRASVIASLREIMIQLKPSISVVGGYWPIRGEIDLSEVMRELIDDGIAVALPVVVEKCTPVEFWNWRTDMPMELGFWDIPVPRRREPVRPDVLLVPLVGFDAACYRLGNGGGYYDRTIAAMTPRPIVLGVGYEFSRLETIFPQPHDIPMDAIITESGVEWRNDALLEKQEGQTAPVQETVSPPCFMADADPAYFGYFNLSESIVYLSNLLRVERDSARTVVEAMLFGGLCVERSVLREQVRLSVRACLILSSALRKLTDNNLAKIPDGKCLFEVLDTPRDSANYLIEMHRHVSDTVRRSLPNIAEAWLYTDMTKLLRIHEAGINQLQRVGVMESPMSEDKVYHGG